MAAPRKTWIACMIAATACAVETLVLAVWGGWWPLPAIAAALMALLAYRTAR